MSNKTLKKKRNPREVNKNGAKKNIFQKVKITEMKTKKEKQRNF